MLNKIQNKYYIYQRGEFMPIYIDTKLANKKEFHLYKLKRAIKLTIYYLKIWHKNLIEA